MRFSLRTVNVAGPNIYLVHCTIDINFTSGNNFKQIYTELECGWKWKVQKENVILSETTFKYLFCLVQNFCEDFKTFKWKSFSTNSKFPNTTISFIIYIYSLILIFFPLSHTITKREAFKVKNVWNFLYVGLLK